MFVAIQALNQTSKEGAHSDGEAFDLPVDVPRLWSQALSKDQKIESVDTAQAAKICFLC